MLDCWLSGTRDLAAAEAFFRCTINSTWCMPEHVVTDKATFYPSVIRTCAPHRRDHRSSGPDLCRIRQRKADRTDCGGFLRSPRQCRRTTARGMGASEL